MNIALAWFRTQINSTKTLRCWYVDHFPDLEACLRDPNRYIDQKFTDWVIARDSREPPDYFADVRGSNICNTMSELDVNANRMRNANIDQAKFFLDGTNQAEDNNMLFDARENDEKRNSIQDEINNNLDENRTQVKTTGELGRINARKIQRSSRRSRNLKSKKSNTCTSKRKHQFLEVPRAATSSLHGSKICMPLREIQDAAPYRRVYVDDSSKLSTVRGKSEAAAKSSRFSFNVSVFRCTVNGCGKLYRRRSHLQSHLRRHTGERPFPCTWDACEWKFSRSDELVRHMRSHSGDKPFNCTTCSKRFARSDHLKKHLRVHQKTPIS